ncbi:hypothetical protein IV203_029586 [Nitzschia inconspicua]|uniref:Uncharacterized protein n=1 Tax=Nitzschia inconspicua TaxID=303405 RepID=A0A9K3LUI8_9STRA|nr:hypothetical protein IV203_029586 [Nitzschia inconspicua]
MISQSTHNQKKVRKRVMVAAGSGLPTTAGAPGLIPYNPGSPSSANPMVAGSSKARHLSPLRRIRNTLRTVLVMSFPLGIFLIPYFLSSPHNPHDYPPIVVTLSTTMERLPLLQPTLDSILKSQSAPPTRVYLILLDPAAHRKDDVMRGRQKEHDGLEKLEAVSVTSSWPAYLQVLVDTTPLRVLNPKIGYGPISKIVYALLQEDIRKQDDVSTTTTANSPFRDTAPRLIYIDDDVVPKHNFVQALMDASIDHPQSAVSFVGGNLRSQFRHVRYAKAEYDKYPNIVMRSLNGGKNRPPMVVDIVQGMTGVCLPITLLNVTEILQLLPSTSVDSWPDITTSATASDILLSAVLAAQNVTRQLVPSSVDDTEDVFFQTIPFTNYSSHPLSTSGKVNKNSYDVAMEWIEVASFFQNEWKIWQQYTFLDPKQLTVQQKRAVMCEGLHDPDCESQADECVASLSACPGALSILNELDHRDSLLDDDTAFGAKKNGEERKK